MDKKTLEKLNRTLDALILLESVRAIRGYPDEEAKAILKKVGLKRRQIKKVLSGRNA